MIKPELELPAFQPAFYNPKNLENPALLEQRRLFFEGMRRKTPETLTDLWDTVLPIYQESYLREFRAGTEPKTDQQALESLNCYYAPVVGAISDWAIRSRLINSSEDNWIVVQANLCLWAWATHPESRKSLSIPFPVATGTARYGRGPAFSFSAPGWEIEFHSWAEYDREVTERFKEHLKAYGAQVRKLAAEAGYEPVPRKRGRSSNDTLIHY